MRNVAKTVNEKMWQHVEDMANCPAFLVKNEGGVQFYVSSLPAPMCRPQIVNTRPNVLGVSWRTYGHMVAEISLFLQKNQIKPGDRVGILGWDSYEWMVINRAVKCLGGIVVPLYPNTTPEQDAHIINDSTPSLLFAQDESLAKKIQPELCTGAPNLRTFLYAEAFQNVPDVTGKNVRSNINLAGRQLVDTVPSDRPTDFSAATKAEFERLKKLFTTAGADPGFKPESVNTLIYTSGSTSLPKGAMHTHESIAASCQLLLDLGFDFNPSDILLHYLPFAHIYGLANGVEMCEWAGVISAFGTPMNMKEVLPLYQPTALLGVPRVWNRMRTEVEAQAERPGFKAKLARWALKQKSGISKRLADLLVFGTIRKRLGMNRVRLIMSGSAAIPMDTVEFFNMIGINLREGYGLTETCGGITASTLADFKFNSLGKAAPGVEYKIIAREGLDNDEPNKGVLWVKGKFLFVGYWNNEKKTKEAFVDGWFNTGDIAHEDTDNFLWYRGRAGRQKKLDTGEFYGEELIQTALENFELVQGAVPTGEGYPYVGALFFVDAGKAKALAGPAPAGVALHEHLAKSDAVREALKKVVTDANAALLAGGQAKKWEQVRAWEIVPIEAKVENGLLTPSQKIKNEEVLKRYADMVKAMYAKNKSRG